MLWLVVKTLRPPLQQGVFQAWMHRQQHSAVFSAHVVNYDNLNIFQQAEGEHSIFAVTSLQFLEYRALKNPNSIGEVDQMLGKIGMPLAFVPLEEHRLAS